MKNIGGQLHSALTAFFFLFVLGASSAIAEESSPDSENASEIAELLKKNLGEKLEIKEAISPVKHYILLKPGQSADMRKARYLFMSKELGLSVKGFKAPIDIGVVCGSDKKIISVFVVQQKDAPKYFARVEKSSLLKNWQGVKSGDPVPDAVSGATFSSKAINGGVQAVLKKLDECRFFERQ